MCISGETLFMIRLAIESDSEHPGWQICDRALLHELTYSKVLINWTQG